MIIENITWLRNVVDKLDFRHNVKTHEVEEALISNPRILFVQKGEREGENVYIALGQTQAGRYLSVFFIYKRNREALILSARDMAKKERKEYEKHRI